MNVSVKFLKKEVSKNLEAKKNRVLGIQHFFNTTVIEYYRELQERRWKSENTTEGKRWDLLKDKRYKEWKAKKYGSDISTGRPLLIASGFLKESVIGPGGAWRKLATPRQLIISTGVEYAAPVNEARNFVSWSERSKNNINRLIKKFIFHGEKRIRL